MTETDLGEERERAGLVAAVARGDTAAFAALYETYLPLVLRWCVRATGDRELAADLSSEVFAAALVHCDRYRPQSGSLGGWLLGIAANKLRDSRRRGRIEDRARRRLGLPSELFTDTDLELVDELVGMDARVDALLSELPDEQRAAVVARVIEQQDYDEIARCMRCSESLVRQRVSRGLRALRSNLEGR